MVVARSRSRRLLFGALTAVLLLGAVELLGVCAYSIQRREWFSYSKVHAAQALAANPPDSNATRLPADWSRQLVAHPFLGYVYDPSSETALADLRPGLRSDPHGFQTAASPLQKRSPDKVIVAVTGGSVAYFLSCEGRDALVAELGRSTALKGKRVELVTLAMAGYKQPQQLLALAWFLALGGEFDIVINLDGFNELALTVTDNFDLHVFPYYPRAWYGLSGQLDDRPLLSTVARLTVERDQRREQARAMRASWLRWSIAADAIWSLRDALHVKAIARLQEQIRDETRRRPRTFLRNGPPVPELADAGARLAEIAQFWKRASLELAALARANGFRYFHFLQANQYDVGSKTLSADEKTRAYNPRSEYVAPIAAGYPLLRAAGAELVANGVAFHDLSRLFADRAETLYADDCCHYDEAGYRLMAARIGRIVRESLDGARR